MTGRTFEISESEYSELADENGGFCIECGETAHGVEPDARAYICDSCGQPGVYGIEELLLMGRIEFSGED